MTPITQYFRLKKSSIMSDARGTSSSFFARLRSFVFGDAASDGRTADAPRRREAPAIPPPPTAPPAAPSAATAAASAVAAHANNSSDVQADDGGLARWRDVLRATAAALLVSGVLVGVGLGARGAWLKWRRAPHAKRQLTGRRATSQPNYALNSTTAGRLAHITSASAASSGAYAVSEDEVRCDDVLLRVLRAVDSVSRTPSPAEATGARLGGDGGGESPGGRSESAAQSSPKAGADGGDESPTTPSKTTGKARRVAVVSRVHL